MRVKAAVRPKNRARPLSATGLIIGERFPVMTQPLLLFGQKLSHSRLSTCSALSHFPKRRLPYEQRSRRICAARRIRLCRMRPAAASPPPHAAPPHWGGAARRAVWAALPFCAKINRACPLSDAPGFGLCIEGSAVRKPVRLSPERARRGRAQDMLRQDCCPPQEPVCMTSRNKSDRRKSCHHFR